MYSGHIQSIKNVYISKIYMLILYRKFMFGIYTIYRGKTRLFHRLSGFSIYCWYTKCVSKIYRGYIGMIQIVYRDYIERVSPKVHHILGSVFGSMLEGYRCVRYLQGAEMEDGENGAKRLWNGYTREKSRFSSRKIDKKMKNCLKWVVRRAFRALTIAI